MNPLAKFFKDALTHWKTSSAGLAAGLLIVANSYQQGMTWKQWAIAGALAFLGLSAPDSSKVAKPVAKAVVTTTVLPLLLVLLLLPGLASAQAAPAEPIFSTSAQAVAVRIGGSTSPGTDVIGSFNLTPSLLLQSDNILAPAINFQGYYGGVKYFAPFLAKPLAKTTLSNIAPYIHVMVGIARNVPALGAVAQHYSFSGDVGFDYKVNSKLSFGPRVGYLNAPGFGGGPHGALISASLTVVLGSK